MRAELLDKTVLAMYDVRGIQAYIFKTNKIKEIIGASVIVENIILDGLNHVIKQEQLSPDLYLTEWENVDNQRAFLDNEEIQMQVTFIGGGNAYVLFRHGKICQQINRKLAKYVLEKTYALNLAVAVVEKTEDYQVDYQKINLEMRRIKATMPETRPLGALPFMHTDSYTGYPLSTYQYEDKKKVYYSTENFLKRASFPQGETEKPEKILDNMVTEKGDNSNLAVVHIDGNNMGKRIQKIMEGKTGYADAILAMRKLSQNIKKSFESSFDVMCQTIDNMAEQIKPDSVGKLYRKIILAGDDITFICNAEIALLAAQTFLKDVSKRYLYQEDGQDEKQRQQEYGFSACAGIAIFNSHFPFSDAYMVAEACCGRAKKIAKMSEHRAEGKKDGMIGNYIDFQICTNVNAVDLSSYRERHYSIDNGSMIARPYYVSFEDNLFDLNERNEEDSVDNFWASLEGFLKFSRSRAKKLRNAYALGNNEVERVKTFLESRKVAFPETDSCYWYDALEMMDICASVQKVVSGQLITD